MREGRGQHREITVDYDKSDLQNLAVQEAEDKAGSGNSSLEADGHGVPRESRCKKPESLERE